MYDFLPAGLQMVKDIIPDQKIQANAKKQNKGCSAPGTI